jgi:hypothetical protein
MIQLGNLEQLNIALFNLLKFVWEQQNYLLQFYAYGKTSDFC